MYTGDSVYNEQELIFRLGQIMAVLRQDDEDSAEDLMRNMLNEMHCEVDIDDMGTLLDECCQMRYNIECQIRDNVATAERKLKTNKVYAAVSNKVWIAGSGITLSAIAMMIGDVWVPALFVVGALALNAAVIMATHSYLNDKAIARLTRESRTLAKRLPDETSIAREFIRHVRERSES